MTTRPSADKRGGDAAEEWDYEQPWRRRGLSGIEDVPGDEIIDVLLQLLDELVKRVGPDEACRLLENEPSEFFSVSSVEELRQQLDELRGRLGY
jgi:hypothetical protein